MVILGWILEKPLPLLFDPFESVVRFHDTLTFFVFMIHAKVLYISGKSSLHGCATALLTAAVNVMTYVVGDGKSNWLEGAILICLFCLSFVWGSQQPLI
jgi:Ca2+:H+ antiporter